MKPAGWLHLAGRFLESLDRRPLDPEERVEVTRWLRPAEVPVFFDQPPQDQRHGLRAARVAAAAGGDLTTIRAALLHDVGKRHARLGTFGRVLATILLRLGLDYGRRFAAYRDHGTLGAEELALLGTEELVVRYAAVHHRGRPADIPAEVWEILDRADRGGWSLIRRRAGGRMART
jgi:putative nucleotidyltransferase with HDIG domain